jgi:hypothetical protein
MCAVVFGAAADDLISVPVTSLFPLKTANFHDHASKTSYLAANFTRS